MYMYIYIYIYNYYYFFQNIQKGKNIFPKICLIYMCVCVCVYIYIYMYVFCLPIYFLYILKIYLNNIL